MTSAQLLWASMAAGLEFGLVIRLVVVALHRSAR